MRPKTAYPKNCTSLTMQISSQTTKRTGDWRSFQAQAIIRPLICSEVVKTSITPRIRLRTPSPSMAATGSIRVLHVISRKIHAWPQRLYHHQHNWARWHLLSVKHEELREKAHFESETRVDISREQIHPWAWRISKAEWFWTLWFTWQTVTSKNCQKLIILSIISTILLGHIAWSARFGRLDQNNVKVALIGL